MKKILFLSLAILFSLINAQANESVLAKQNTIQTRINKTGTKILNSNKLNKRVVFVYDNESKEGLIKGTKPLTKRQVVVYEEIYKYIENDDELAGFVSREIAAAYRSYDGFANGWLSSIKIKAAPKKYEFVFDKMAVDYMVKAGYNPIGLITYINKTCPQKHGDRFSSHNLTSKRLANIYERIYTKYPYFIENNSYLYNDYYQNFLLTSQENRKKLEEKILSGDKKKRIKYE